MNAIRKILLQLLREVSGDAAYQRYLRHHRRNHPNDAPLDRKAFFDSEQTRKWSGINRCC